MWGDNVNMMLDGNLTVAPIVGDCSIAWGFAEAGIFWTGKNPLRVDDVGVVCAGPFASLAKSTAAAAAAAGASKRVSRSEEDDEIDVQVLTYVPDMQYQRTKASTPTGLYNLHSTTLEAFEDKTAFVRSIDHLKSIATVGLPASSNILLGTAVELAASYDFGAAPQPAFIIRNKRSDPARLYRLRGSLAGLIRPTSDLAVVNCQCRLVTAGRTQGKTENLHVFATREIQYGEELRVHVAPFIVL